MSRYFGVNKFKKYTSIDPKLWVHIYDNRMPRVNQSFHWGWLLAFEPLQSIARQVDIPLTFTANYWIMLVQMAIADRQTQLLLSRDRFQTEQLLGFRELSGHLTKCRRIEAKQNIEKWLGMII